MISITAQPFNQYFVWQIEVQIVNFRKHGLEDSMHVLVWYSNDDSDLSAWHALEIKYPKVKFFFYKDKGVNGSYIPQLRPQILATHFDEHPELKNEVIFYHDSDIIINFSPDFQKLAEGPINWQSDTSHYLDYDYLYRKEKEGNIPEYLAISTLCKIGRIPVTLMKHYTKNTGGAQSILKEIDGDFWRDVERQCLEIRRAFTHVDELNAKRDPRNKVLLKESINTLYFPDEDRGFQSWCADMWALNMALWSRGKRTQVTDELDFSWAGDSDEIYKKKPIYHNTGGSGDGIFNKTKWIETSPLGRKHSVRKSSASYYYVQAIYDVE